MKTLYEVKQMLDAENRTNLTIELPWDQCHLARVYDHLDQSYEGGSLFDILSVTPVSFNKERETITINVLIDASDALDEYPEDENQDEVPDPEESPLPYMPAPVCNCQG
jgi:hypothetical protein